jgi:hypothetical protein
MATFIQEVLGLLAKKKTVNTLIKDKDYFELGRKRDSSLVTGGYSPEMDALAIKAEDLMCVMLSNTLQGGVNYVPIFSPAIPGSNCPKGPLVNSKLYQNPSTGTLEFKDDAKFEHGVIDTTGSYGTAGQVLASTVTGVQWVTNGSGTVTSVDVSGGTTGLTFSGGPITGSGILTLGGVLAPANGGDQVVTITAGSNVTVTGSYPNFTVAATATSVPKAYLSAQWRGTINPYFPIPTTGLPVEIPFDHTYFAFNDGGAAGIGFYNPTATEARFVIGQTGLYKVSLSLNLDNQSETLVTSLRAFLFDNTIGQRVLQLIYDVPATSSVDNLRLYKGSSDFILTASHEYSIIVDANGTGSGSNFVYNYAVTDITFESIKI